MSLVWQLELPDSEKIVLLALADCANDEGHCWPGMKSLVAKCSKTDRTIQTAIQSLCDKGHLTRREVLGKGCNYTVHPRSDFAPEAISPRKDCGTPPKPVRETPEAASGKPSKNRKEKSYIKGVGLPDWIPAEPWAAYVRMRKAKDKGFTEDAARGAIREADKLRGQGYDPAKLLWRAVDKGWKGVYPHDDCKAVVALKVAPEDFAERARFFDSIGQPDKAEEYRRRATSIGQIANDLARQARAS